MATECANPQVLAASRSQAQRDRALALGDAVRTSCLCPLNLCAPAQSLESAKSPLCSDLQIAHAAAKLVAIMRFPTPPRRAAKGGSLFEAFRPPAVPAERDG